jgi:hypothetical protein
VSVNIPGAHPVHLVLFWQVKQSLKTSEHFSHTKVLLSSKYPLMQGQLPFTNDLKVLAGQTLHTTTPDPLTEQSVQ